MANDRLRTAMLAANLTLDELASKLDRDPKTVGRWISKEIRPHPGTRREITKLLGVREPDLWPELADSPQATSANSELFHLYPSRSAMTGRIWESLLNNVQDEMDILVFSGAFLVEQYDLVPLIRSKVKNGTRFRLLIGDEKSPAVIQRAIEEGTPGGLEGRIQLMRRYLADVANLAGVEVRTHGTTLYNSIYKFDDNLLVNGHAHGALAGQNPVMHYKRTDDGPIWQHYMRSFERVWATGTPEQPPEG